MATNPTTPTQRITRLLGEGVRILAVHQGDAGIDITHDITGLLEQLRNSPQSPLMDRQSPDSTNEVAEPLKASLSDA